MKMPAGSIMNYRHRMDPVSRMQHAFTLVEVLVVIAIIGVLAALSVPLLGKAMEKSRRIQCLSQLHQIGVASQSFAQDHNDRLPVQLWTNGCWFTNHQHTVIATGALVRSSCAFLAMSNELANPQLLMCPSEKRHSASNWPSVRDDNVAYLVGLQGAISKPVSILAMDGNVTNTEGKWHLDLEKGGAYAFAWTGSGHRTGGNVLFADAHVEFRKNLQMTVLPVVKPAPEPAKPGSPPDRPGAGWVGRGQGGFAYATGSRKSDGDRSSDAQGTSSSTQYTGVESIAHVPAEGPVQEPSPGSIIGKRGGAPSSNGLAPTNARDNTETSRASAPVPSDALQPPVSTPPVSEPPVVVNPTPSTTFPPVSTRPDWDTETYRRIVSVLGLLLLLLLLWAMGVLAVYLGRWWTNHRM